MNIYKFFRPNISEFFIGNLIEDNIALDLITNKEVDVSNCDKSEIDLFSNQHIIDSLEKYFLAKNKFIFKFYVPYGKELSKMGTEYFGFKIYNFEDNTSEFDYTELINILNSRIDLITDPGEYAFFKSQINLKYLTFYTLNSLIDECLYHNVMNEDEIKEFLSINLLDIK